MKTIAQVVLVCAPLLLSACAASANDPAPPPDAQGALFVSWTFDQKADPAECNTSKLGTLEIVVTTEDMSTTVGRMSEPCASLIGAIALPAGRYVGTAHFVDATGVVKSEMIQTKNFEMTEGEHVNAKLDFSGDALF
ncbi:MAG: hypothetical protein ABI461_01580 [Polyangiaceae bacterium]